MVQNLFLKKLLPAVTLNDADSALSVAEALLEGGLNVMEVTFRTSATAPAIGAIAKEFPEMKIGAGTILSPEQVASAINAGAQFGLAPGFNKEVVRKAEQQEFPFIPGVMTPSEIEKALAMDCEILKLFPVSQVGGTEYIRSIEGPYRHTGIKFLPMGGVNPSNLKSYLECDSVIAAGGSWMTPTKAIENGKFDKVTELVRISLKIAEEWSTENNTD